jgi:competence protein ComEA
MPHRTIKAPPAPTDPPHLPPVLGRWPRPSPSQLALGAVGVVVAAIGAWWLLRPPEPPIEQVIPRARPEAAAAPGGGDEPTAAAAASSSSTSAVGAAELVVQAAGAVERPGVYRMGSGARVDDLVRAAGGLAGDADADRVNLAAPVADGERVWVPRRGEPVPPPVVAGAGGGAAVGTGGGPSPGGGAGGSAGPAPGPPVSLSTATADQLDALPGVGPATAAAIIAYRDQHGAFSSVDDLLEVRGIGEAKLEQLRPLVQP